MRTHNCKDTLCVTPHYPEPIETGYTDENIPIECAECSKVVEGCQAIHDHILFVHHKDYTPEQAKTFAQIWTEGAYERVEEELANQEPENDSDKDYGD